MRLIFAIVLLAGLGLAGFAIMQAQGRFSAYETALNETRGQVVDVTDVYVVNRSLGYGDRLAEEDVVAIRWPADSLPDGAFDTLETIFPEDADGPRTVLRAMERGEPLLAVKVTEPGASAGVATSLTPGMRAFTLQVDITSGVSGFLRPGDRVDVYWTGNAEGGGVTRLIQASLPLIAIDQDADDQNRGPAVARTVTVEAPPAVVAKLAQAQATGQLTLALVGVGDEAESDTVEATLAQILGPKDEVVVERERTCSVRARRGATVEIIPIPCPGDAGAVPVAPEAADAGGVSTSDGDGGRYLLNTDS